MLSYMAPRPTVQQLLQNYPLPCNKNAHVAKVLQRIKNCRTAAWGIMYINVRQKIVAVLNISIIAAETGIVLIAAQ